MSARLASLGPGQSLLSSSSSARSPWIPSRSIARSRRSDSPSPARGGRSSPPTTERRFPRSSSGRFRRSGPSSSCTASAPTRRTGRTPRLSRPERPHGDPARRAGLRPQRARRATPRATAGSRVAAIDSLARALALEKFDFVGHSLGGSPRAGTRSSSPGRSRASSSSTRRASPFPRTPRPSASASCRGTARARAGSSGSSSSGSPRPLSASSSTRSAGTTARARPRSTVGSPRRGRRPLPAPRRPSARDGLDLGRAARRSFLSRSRERPPRRCARLASSSSRAPDTTGPSKPRVPRCVSRGARAAPRQEPRALRPSLRRAASASFCSAFAPSSRPPLPFSPVSRAIRFARAVRTAAARVPPRRSRIATSVLGRAWSRFERGGPWNRDDRVFAPYPDSWGLSEGYLVEAIVGYPWARLTGSPAARYDVPYARACVFAFWSSGALFLRLAGPGWPALLGALLFAWSPGRLNSAGVLGVLWAGLVPLAIAFGLDVLSRGRGATRPFRRGVARRSEWEASTASSWVASPRASCSPRAASFARAPPPPSPSSRGGRRPPRSARSRQPSRSSRSAAIST